MARPDWNIIEELFHAVLERPPEERERFLAREAGNNPLLLREVRSLLEAYDRDPEFLETPAVRITGDRETTGEEEMTGKQVGSYTVVRRIGRGGMGTVWLAERSDKEFSQQVALKIVKRGMDSEEIVRRFRTERRILASLQHPHIARLIDGGILGDGRPWFAMDYVEGGVPLNEYCNARRFPVSDRLSLFLSVCSAVMYAHRNLIVHRDLKMNNILVSGEGEVKLLDFGIAKLLSPEIDDGGTTLTMHRLLTPDYASPEQIRGEPITTAADVYSLGVLLYELLSGFRPYRLLGLSTAEIEEKVCRQSPLPPSVAFRRGRENLSTEEIARHRRTTPSRLRGRLRGDPDTIVLTAMHRDPVRRYRSVEEMAEDIERYLQGLPLRARRDSIPYLAGKFIGRHKFGIAAAGTLFTSVTGFGTAMTIQRNRIARQAEQIGKERDKAERIADFLKSLFSSNDPAFSRGKEMTALEVLEQGLLRVEETLRDRPELQVEILLMVGEVYLEMGSYDRAESVFRRAVRLARLHPPDDPLLPAAALHALGAALKCRNGDYVESLTLFCDAFEIFRKVRLADPERETDKDIAHILNDIGVILLNLDQTEDAERLFRIVVELRRRIYAGDHHHIAYTLNNLSISLQRSGPDRFEEGAALTLEAVEMLARLNGEDHPDTATGFYNLAQLYYRLGRIGESDEFHLRTLVIRRKLFKRHRNLAHSLLRVGEIMTGRGEFEEAERHLNEGLEMLRTIQGSGHPDVAEGLVSLGRYRMRKGEPEEAETLFHQAIEVLREKSKDSLLFPTIYLLFGELEQDRGNDRKAEGYYRKGLELLERENTKQVWVEDECRTALAGILAERGSVDEATALLETTLRSMRKRGDRRATMIAERLEGLRERADRKGKSVRLPANKQG